MNNLRPIFYEFVELSRINNSKLYPSSVNMEERYKELAEAADLIFEKRKPSYPIFDLRGALDRIDNEESTEITTFEQFDNEESSTTSDDETENLRKSRDDYFQANYPSSVNMDEVYQKLAEVGDKVFEEPEAEYPIFNLGSALDQIQEEQEKTEPALVTPSTKENKIEEKANEANSAPVRSLNPRIKALQEGIKLPLPGAMPFRKVKQIQVERTIEKKEESKESQSDATNRLTHLTKARPIQSGRRLPTKKQRTSSVNSNQ